MKDCCQSKQADLIRQESSKSKTERNYTPLFMLLGVSFLFATTSMIQYGGFSKFRWMHSFMGFFLVVFALLKLFDLKGFAKGFAKYDLLAIRVPTYAKVYPFIELLLGLAYLTHRTSSVIYIATIVVMGFGAIGVFVALRKKLDVNCACMGSTLNVPLSTVALVENLGMVAMALMMLADVMWRVGLS